MKKQVTLTLEGNWTEGFSVNLEIRKDETPFTIIFADVGKLPVILDINIRESFSQWQSDFNSLIDRNKDLYEPRSRIKSTKQGVTKINNESAKKLVLDLNRWLNYDENSWKKIVTNLQKYLNPEDEIRVIIRTEDICLRQLPWSAWNLFYEDYQNSEISLSTQRVQTPSIENINNQRSKVRILAIFGKSNNINIQFDREILERLTDQGAEIVPLDKPSKNKLLEYLADENGWQIFCFAGHSSSQTDGQIGEFEINDNESLKIDELKNAFKTAIAKGLQLAIFNSCDGLGLANQLANLHLPQSIVMREIVPDEVAQKFLQHFLTAFANNKSLYISMRTARNKLEDANNQQYPGIHWLPIIYQNPAVEPLTWLEMGGKPSTTKLLKENLTWKCLHTLTEHSELVRAIAISPDGEIIASASLDHTIKIWSLITGELLNTITGHSGPVTCVTFSNDGKTLASSSAYKDGTIKLWDIKTGNLKSTLKGDDWVVLSIWSIAISPDGKMLASGHHADSTVKIWNLETQKIERILRGHVWAVESVKFSPNGQILVSGSLDSNIKIWNPYTGRQIRNLNGPQESPISLVKSWFSDKSVYTVAFSPDGQNIASGGAKQPIQLWRLSNGEVKTNLTGHTDTVYSVAFSPDGKTLASGSADCTIRIWDLFTGEPIHTLGHSSDVYSVAFSPDGQTLVSSSSDRTIKIWRLSA